MAIKSQDQLPLAHVAGEKILLWYAYENLDPKSVFANFLDFPPVARNMINFFS